MKALSFVVLASFVPISALCQISGVQIKEAASTIEFAPDGNHDRSTSDPGTLLEQIDNWSFGNGDAVHAKDDVLCTVNQSGNALSAYGFTETTASVTTPNPFVNGAEISTTSGIAFKFTLQHAGVFSFTDTPYLRNFHDGDWASTSVLIDQDVYHEHADFGQGISFSTALDAGEHMIGISNSVDTMTDSNGFGLGPETYGMHYDFSLQTTPEPGTMAALGLGGLALCRRRRPLRNRP